MQFSLCELPAGIKLPFFEALIPAGFPSPAADYAKKKHRLKRIINNTPGGNLFFEGIRYINDRRQY